MLKLIERVGLHCILPHGSVQAVSSGKFGEPEFGTILTLVFLFAFWEHSEVRIISRKALTQFAARHREAKEPLDNWYRRTRKAHWKNLAEVRADYPHADLVGTCVVFNIAGNKYRLITRIFFRSKRVYIRVVMPHKEYDKGEWKNDCSG